LCIHQIRDTSWKAYKIAGQNGEPRSDLACRINQIQDALVLERSTFPELEGIQDFEQEREQLTPEDIQLRREEQESINESFENEYTKLVELMKDWLK